METRTILWGKIAAGDKEAYADLFRDFYRRLYNYGKKFTTDESLIEDAAQETLLIIWQKRESIPVITYPETYSYSIFRNTLFTRLKTQQRYGAENTVAEEPEFGIDHIIISRETDTLTTQKIQKALAALTSRQREAIFLRFYEGLPYEEVASTLGITTKATYKIVARALDELRQQLNMPNGLLIGLLTRLLG
ncbi:RNA polymerase sigma factor [Lacibacter sediminis]|uniref:RNA polymerase sigma factor n=1 Tax=Lacibacter sediminis TaxID=2760713 RepID=A0A7G5XKH5_9BACT|nr:RNA polymerase sigma factor [Lacibacter sediminis]QNA45978.1 RNA polymerase sigma factor [Lacibacter sediminis]